VRHLHSSIRAPHCQSLSVQPSPFEFITLWKVTSYAVQARPGAYVADSARGAILQTDHVLRF
jgi:hypothetical protein